MESEGWIAVRNSVNNANRNTLCKLIITQRAAFARLFRREAENSGSVTQLLRMFGFASIVTLTLSSFRSRYKSRIVEQQYLISFLYKNEVKNWKFCVILNDN
jgi:hypothetical protein